MGKCRTISQDEFDKILRLHEMWLLDEEGGERANLEKTNLAYANLSGINLSGANFDRAYLPYANLSGANLSGANFYGAVLTRYVNLSGANLSGANLERAWLIRANLSGANLSGANMTRTDLGNADLRNAIWDTNTKVDGARFDGAKLTLGFPVSGAALPAWESLSSHKNLMDKLAESKGKFHLFLETFFEVIAAGRRRGQKASKSGALKKLGLSGVKAVNYRLGVLESVLRVTLIPDGESGDKGSETTSEAEALYAYLENHQEHLRPPT